MRKIRTLTNKSLDELEKVMPRISELSQRQLIGGDFYYNASGVLIYETPGSTMWITPHNTQHPLGFNEGGSSSGNAEKNHQNKCTVFSTVDRLTQMRVLTTMAREKGYANADDLIYVQNDPNPLRYTSIWK